MAANLARLTDLTTELRRQLKPLGRQAEMARRAQTIQADLRDARLRLAADDLVIRRAEFAGADDIETTLRREHDEAAARLAAATEQLAAHEAAVATLSERTDAAQQTWFRLSALAERVNATVRIASERAQYLEIEQTVSSGPDPEALEAEAAEVAEREQQLLAELNEARARLETARAALAEKERAATEAERAHLAAVRAEADRREGLARLAGQVETVRARVESIDDGVARLTAAIEEAAARAQQAQAEFEIVQGRVGELDQGEVGLDEQHDRTVAALRLADERVTELQAAERGAERQVASLRARIDALAVGLERKDGAAWLVENRSSSGLFGTIAKLVKVSSGYETALAAVLGAAADAVAADDARAARAAVRALKDADGGQAAIVLADWPAAAQHRTPLPEDVHWALDLIEAPPRLQGAMSAMLADVAVVRDLGAGLDLVAGRPTLRAVTLDGDLVGPGWVSGGSDRKPSTLEIASEIDKAEGELAAAEKLVGELTAALAGALDEQSNRQDAAEQALAALSESDAAISAIYEQLGRLGSEARAAEEDDWRRQVAQRGELEAGRVQTVEELTELENRLNAAQDIGAVVDPRRWTGSRCRPPPVGPRRRGGGATGRAHRRGARECRSGTGGFAAPGGGRRTRGAAARQRARAAREHAATVAAAVSEAGQRVAERLTGVVAAASRSRDALAAERQQRATAMAAAREEVAVLNTRIGALTDSLHRDEVAKAQAALRIEQLEQMVLEQFGMAADDLIAEYGPDVALPPSELEMAEYEQARERGEQVTTRRRCRSTDPPRSAAPNGPSGNWPSSAGSTRWRSRSSRRWRSATTSCPPSSRTSRPPAGPAGCDRRRRQPDPAGLRRGLRRRGARVRAGVRHAVPGRRGPAAAHRPRRPADHRRRGRGPSAGQEDQAAVAAVRR